MASMDEMDEFVNWDNAGASVGNADFPQDPDLSAVDLDVDNMNLVFANVGEDDFSFSALEHFAENNFPLDTLADDTLIDDALVGEITTLPALDDMPMDLTTAMDFWDTPASPCANCTLGGYSCKTIREGRYKGYCTSCVALRVECSFGGVIPDSLNPESTTFSNSAWPTQGDRPNSNPLEELTGVLQPIPQSSTFDFLNSGNNSESEMPIVAPKPGPGAPPKIGARFSRDSVRILKNWLTSHNRHPYPSDEEKEALQRQTGLNKVQITNWLANARRRGKVQAPRSTSPQVGAWASGAIDIPKRRGTPALEAMNPLQRWEHSPPEHEPASVTAIARAVAGSSSGVSSGLNSPYSYNLTDDGSGRSLCELSSASSLGTSRGTSKSSGNSAYSHGSRNSWGSFGSAPFNNRGHRRRRRRAGQKQTKDSKTSLAAPLKTFQCTFCTETFRTKHDWQRHEKSLHLSLERWVCAPDGPRMISPENGQLSCVFCGIPNPDEAHVESHNHSVCQERTLEERTFYRKDHLNQHLRLVHNVKFMDWSMKPWKIATPEIRSRCGFCGIVMDTWTIRVDHLAEHFKTGYSMADWKGDWGFDVPVLDMVENSIPPYLIHHERTSPLPYVASHSPPESPRNAYELIKLEMAYFGANHIDQHGRPPTDEEMMVEGCRIIFASELLSLQGIATQDSWLRDLIMKSVDLSQKAKFGPLRSAAESRLATLKINGKDNLFEECPMEIQLQSFVRAKRLLGLTAMDDELQQEACCIVGRVEEISTHPSDPVANWLLRLVVSSTHWLGPFRRRAHLPRTEDVQDSIFRSTDPTSIDSTIHSYSRLERELGDFLKMQRIRGAEPSDEDLQRQARIIIYEFDDGWNQTAADNGTWLDAFKQRHPVNTASPTSDGSLSQSLQRSGRSNLTGACFSASSGKSPIAPVKQQRHDYALDERRKNDKAGGSDTPFFLNDANCYRRVARELGRWVAATMSPNNPNCHVPTDAELQHQARWILYDDDDLWNQTAADNAEWLLRFKRDTGIIKEAGPGLPEGTAWALEQGGTGFAPPYACPKGNIEPFNDNVQVEMREGGRQFPAGQSAANSYLSTLKSRDACPAAVFCSRELEEGLLELAREHVKNTGRLPSDATLHARAREISRAEHTAAEDPELLNKFKQLVRKELPDAGEAQRQDLPSALPSNMDLNISDEDLGSILHDMDMNFQFDTQDFGGELETGGVSLGGFRD